MKKLSRILAFSVLTFFFAVNMATATTLSDYIGSGATSKTVSDGFASPGLAEDNEVETGMMPGQMWDMEAIYWNQTTSTLYMVAGYDFLGSNYNDGRAAGDSRWSAGDVFLFGATYDYALDLNRVGGVKSNLDLDTGDRYFDAYRANANLSLYQASGYQGVAWEQVYFAENYPESNPYARIDNAQDSLIGDNIAYGYSGALTGDMPGATAWDTGTHYVLSLNLAGINIAAGNYTVHMTMECGNDVMRGDLLIPAGNPVPEPATMLLFGAGMIGLAGFGRSRFLKKS